MIQNAETYLASLITKMRTFRDTTFTSTEQQDAALTELLAVPDAMLGQMEKDCETSDSYWECACEDQYIHIKEGSGSECNVCSVCDVEEEDASDARLVDVIRNLMGGGYLTKEPTGRS